MSISIRSSETIIFRISRCFFESEMDFMKPICISAMLFCHQKSVLHYLVKKKNPNQQNSPCECSQPWPCPVRGGRCYLSAGPRVSTRASLHVSPFVCNAKLCEGKSTSISHAFLLRREESLQASVLTNNGSAVWFGIKEPGLCQLSPFYQSWRSGLHTQLIASHEERQQIGFFLLS